MFSVRCLAVADMSNCLVSRQMAGGEDPVMNGCGADAKSFGFRGAREAIGLTECVNSAHRCAVPRNGGFAMTSDNPI